MKSIRLGSVYVASSWHFCSIVRGVVGNAVNDGKIDIQL
jgi:acyl dehydratase